jgi:hypothetical protein
VPGQDRVYRAIVKTDKLSTKFQNWIEEDLLKLNAFDVKEVIMDDHSVDELNPQQQLVQRGLTIVDYDNKESKWKLVKMEIHDQGTGKWEDVALTDDQELDTQKLNDLKTALDDLKIVDVRRKPQGLSNDLKAGEELVADRATRQALRQRGFYLAQVQGGYALFSNEGEVRCGLNDGVEYILRFGEIAGQSSDDDEDKKADAAEGAEAEKPADKDADKGKDAAKDKGVDRYIMVTAQFRQDLIPKPELQPLPEGYEESADEPAAPGDSTSTEGATKEGAAADAPDGKPADGESDIAPKNDSAGAAAANDDMLLALADAAQPKKGAQPKNETKAASGAKPASAAQPAATDEPAEDAAAADKKADEPVDPDAAAEAEEKAKAAKAAEAKRIKEDNKRKEDDYNKKVADGEKRVKELNERFADWYYVISDNTYKKIHITRDELVKEKTKPAAEANNPPGPNLPLQGLPQGLPK